jgi:hypothetical protein
MVPYFISMVNTLIFSALFNTSLLEELILTVIILNQNNPQNKGDRTKMTNPNPNPNG